MNIRPLTAISRAGIAHAAFGNPIPKEAYQIIAAVEAHYLNQPRSYAAPVGWKLVPIIPTQEMKAKAHRPDSYGYGFVSMHTGCDIYSKMIEVAPEPPKSTTIIEAISMLSDIVDGMRTKSNNNVMIKSSTVDAFADEINNILINL